MIDASLTHTYIYVQSTCILHFTFYIALNPSIPVLCRTFTQYEDAKKTHLDAVYVVVSLHGLGQKVGCPIIRSYINSLTWTSHQSGFLYEGTKKNQKLHQY